MNIETNKETNFTQSSFRNKEANFLSANLSSFTTNYFLAPFLNQEIDNPFITTKTASELKLTIPQLIDNLFTAVRNNSNDDTKLAIGGSSMEVLSGLLSPNLYWETKRHFITDILKRPEIKEAKDLLKKPLEKLAYGDSDLDLYIEKNQSLEETFIKLHEIYQLPKIETTNNQDKMFLVKIPDSSINLSIYLGSAYKGSHIDRLYMQLKDIENRPLFHIDLTATRLMGDKKALDRRKTIGSIHDLCRGEVDTNTGQVLLNKENIQNPSEPSQMRLEEKDINTIPEIVMREMRKKLFHLTSNNFQLEKTSIYQLFPLLESTDLFFLREFTSNPDGNLAKIVSNQTEYQKSNLNRELLLMSQIDPYLTLVFLMDTGFDAIFFGRHLSRKEGLRVLTSPWLDINSNSNINSQNISIENSNQSRLNFLNLNLDDSNRNGFVRFTSALGQGLGPNPSEYEVHFKDGLNLLENSEPLPKKVFLPLVTTDESLLDMYNAITEWGGLTETALHTILNKKNPQLYPNLNDEDKKIFRSKFLKLKMSGVLEVAKRELIINNKSISAFFYYATDSNKETFELLPWTDNMQNKPEPSNSEYWKNLINNGNLDNFLKISSIIPENLANAWIKLSILGIKSLEAYLGIRESDWEIIKEQSLIDEPIQIGYENIAIIRDFLISRQKESEKEGKIRSWIYPQWDTD